MVWTAFVCVRVMYDSCMISMRSYIMFWGSFDYYYNIIIYIHIKHNNYCRSFWFMVLVDMIS